MFFDLTLGIPEVSGEILKINHREAVRGVIVKDDKLLMVQTNKGDYKFPGGGVEKNENHETTLIREVREETGYLIECVHEKIGSAIERSLDQFEEQSLFEMVSHYYFCEVTKEQVKQQLDDYEEELGFLPKWVNVDTAIHNNEDILKGNAALINRWVDREICVLRELNKKILKVKIDSF